MFKMLLRSFISMLRSSKRMPGRSWGSEMLFRTLRNLFLAGQSRGLVWFRQQTAKPISHPAISKVVRVKQSVAGVPCTLVRPNKGGDAKVVIVYLHGGGYVVGSPSGHLSLIAPLALETDCLVIAPDYRLAPEHPFPAPQDDCLAVARAARKTYPTHKLVIAGDSAGAALAIATQLSMHQAGEPAADGLILISPWVDPLADSGTIHSNAENDYLAKQFLDDSMQALMGDQAWNEPRINFTQVDLSGLPSTLVQYGSGEIFADQISQFCERANAQGVVLEVQKVTAQFHVFQLFSGLLKDAKAAIRSMGSFIRAL